MRARAALIAVLSLAACGGGSHHVRKAATDDLSAIEALPSSSIPLGSSGAPITGVTVSGTITDADARLLRCRPESFLLLTPQGNAIAPVRQFCDKPVLHRGKSGYFTATFVTADLDGLRIRFEHPNGNYETHDLILPPQ